MHLPTRTGGWRGETLSFNDDDFRQFLKSVGIEREWTEADFIKAKEMLDKAADRAAKIMSVSRTEPTQAMWRGSFKKIAKLSLELRKQFAGQVDVNQQDLEISEVADRLGMSAHAVLFGANKEIHDGTFDRDQATSDTILDLVALRIEPHGVLEITQEFPRMLQVIELVATIAASKPMVFPTIGQPGAICVLADCYEQLTDLKADQGQHFRQFVEKLMEIMGASLHSDGRMLIRRALAARVRVPTMVDGD